MSHSIINRTCDLSGGRTRTGWRRVGAVALLLAVLAARPSRPAAGADVTATLTNGVLLLETNLSASEPFSGSSAIEIRGRKDGFVNVIPREGTTLNGSLSYLVLNPVDIIVRLRNTSGECYVMMWEFDLDGDIIVQPPVTAAQPFVEVDILFCNAAGDIDVSSLNGHVNSCEAKNISLFGQHEARLAYCTALDSLRASSFNYLSCKQCTAGSDLRAFIGGTWAGTPVGGKVELTQCVANRNLEVFGARGRDFLTLDALGAGQLVVDTGGDNDDISLGNCVTILQPKIAGGQGKDDWVRDRGGNNFDKLTFSNTQGVEHFKYDY